MRNQIIGLVTLQGLECSLALHKDRRTQWFLKTALLFEKKISDAIGGCIAWPGPR